MAAEVTRVRSAVRLSELLSGFVEVAARDDRGVVGLSADSRGVLPGELFCAYRGTTHDGTRFIADARARGAAAILVDRAIPDGAGSLPVIEVPRLRERIGTIASRFFGEPSRQLLCIGVTGTNGKTTVAHLCAQALGPECGYAGTLGIGTVGNLGAAVTTTPDPITLQSHLADLVDAGAHASCIEASSHALDQDRLGGTDFDIGVFTNLGRDHLDYHANSDAYAAAKRRLFTHFALDAAVINGDDPVGRALLDELPERIDAWTFGAAEVAHRRGRAVTVVAMTNDGRRSRLTLQTPDGGVAVTTPLLGDFNGLNLAATYATLRAAGVDHASASAALGRVEPIAGRMQLLRLSPAGPRVLVDFAHTPDSLAAALGAARGLAAGGRLLVVFGCGGDRDRTKRPTMGAIAEREADGVWVTTDNARGEEPAAIAAEILAGMAHPDRARYVAARDVAIAEAIAAAAATDVIVVAGKGHERTQTIGREVLPFDDVAQARAALQRWRP